MHSKKYKVGILAATGVVGQRFIQLLDQHPMFEITAVAASDSSVGNKYSESVFWTLPVPIPKQISEMVLLSSKDLLGCDFVFSALPAELGHIEERFAFEGCPVISNSSAHRLAKDVPLLVPEINPNHLELIDLQRKNRNFNKNGYIITNPNCTTTVLVLALAPLDQMFGIESVMASSMQAISGAGNRGVAALEVIDNLLPFIKGEESKLETEPLKILGKLANEQISPAKFGISAHCNRVPVTDGHSINVSVKLKKSPGKLEDIKHVLKSFSGLPQEHSFPSAPQQVIVVMDKEDRPQPRLDRDTGMGMSIVIGRLRQDPVWDIKFTVLGHNTIRGAAGAAILNAELLVYKKYL